MGTLSVVSADATLARTLLESSYCDLFTTVQETPPLVVSYRRLPVISHLEEFKIFDTVFPSCIVCLLQFASSLKSTCFGARHTWPNHCNLPYGHFSRNCLRSLLSLNIGNFILPIWSPWVGVDTFAENTRSCGGVGHVSSSSHCRIIGWVFRPYLME